MIVRSVFTVSGPSFGAPLVLTVGLAERSTQCIFIGSVSARFLSFVLGKMAFFDKKKSLHMDAVYLGIVYFRYLCHSMEGATRHIRIGAVCSGILRVLRYRGRDKTHSLEIRDQSAEEILCACHCVECITRLIPMCAVSWRIHMCVYHSVECVTRLIPMSAVSRGIRVCHSVKCVTRPIPMGAVSLQIHICVSQFRVNDKTHFPGLGPGVQFAGKCVCVSQCRGHPWGLRLFSWRVSKCVGACCGVLQRDAAHYSALQRLAIFFMVWAVVRLSLQEPYEVCCSIL